MNIAVPFLAFVSCAGIVLFLAYERVFETSAAKAAARVIGPSRAGISRGQQPQKGLFAVTGPERELSVRLKTAGLDWTPAKFWTVVATLPLLLGAGVAVGAANWIFGVLVALAAALAAPRLALTYLERRRIRLFTQRLPAALDVLIRGAKAGLPLNDCVRLVAAEAPDPIATEFRTILKDQAVGRTLPEAVRLMAERLNTPEAHLLSIVVQVQMQTGGNISEILTSFSNSVRARMGLKDKIRTITAESKYAAFVLSLLPFGAFYLVNSAFPERTRLLFETTLGNMVLIGTCGWMAIGLAIIFKLVNMKV
jgi:tight adherence protein B